MEKSNRAFPLTPPSPSGPSGRGRTCERFVNDRGMLASIPRIEARRQGSPTNTCTTERHGALGLSRRAEWLSLSPRERDGVRGKGLVCRLRLSFQPLARVSIRPARWFRMPCASTKSTRPRGRPLSFMNSRCTLLHASLGQLNGPRSAKRKGRRGLRCGAKPDARAHVSIIRCQNCAKRQRNGLNCSTRTACRCLSAQA